MKADEVQPRTCLSAHVIFLMRAMVEKQSQEFRRLGIARTCAVRTADTSLGKCAQDRVDSEIVKLEIFFRRPLPVIDVGLIPNFPQPGLHLGSAVALAQMPDKLIYDVRPSLIIPGRICPAGENLTLR